MYRVYPHDDLVDKVVSTSPYPFNVHLISPRNWPHSKLTFQQQVFRHRGGRRHPVDPRPRTWTAGLSSHFLSSFYQYLYPILFCTCDFPLPPSSLFLDFFFSLPLMGTALDEKIPIGNGPM